MQLLKNILIPGTKKKDKKKNNFKECNWGSYKMKASNIEAARTQSS